MRKAWINGIAGVATALAVAAAAGCGSSSSSSSDIASKPPATIVKSSMAAAQSLKSVHTAGALASGGQHIAIDLNLVSGVGGRGQITLNGSSFQLVGLRDHVYMKAPAEVWQRAGVPASAAKRLDGKWLRTSATGQFASIGQLTDIHQLFAQLLKPHGNLKAGGTSTVAGRKVVAVKSSEGTLYVAATGKPYPVQLAKSGGNGGRLTFDRFNEPITVAAPTNTVDLPQAGG